MAYYDAKTEKAIESAIKDARKRLKAGFVSEQCADRLRLQIETLRWVLGKRGSKMWKILRMEMSEWNPILKQVYLGPIIRSLNRKSILLSRLKRRYR